MNERNREAEFWKGVACGLVLAEAVIITFLVWAV